jgi:PadR family transcriptional regulator PadR
MSFRFEPWITEMCLLAKISSKEAYGYELIKTIGLPVSESSLYPILRRLENKGYLTVSSQIIRTKLRKIYHITHEGHDKLGQLKEGWQEYKKNVDHFLEPVRPC